MFNYLISFISLALFTFCTLVLFNGYLHAHTHTHAHTDSLHSLFSFTFYWLSIFRNFAFAVFRPLSFLSCTFGCRLAQRVYETGPARWQLVSGSSSCTRESTERAKRACQRERKPARAGEPARSTAKNSTSHAVSTKNGSLKVCYVFCKAMAREPEQEMAACSVCVCVCVPRSGLRACCCCCCCCSFGFGFLQKMSLAKRANWANWQPRQLHSV